jgi:hypothetical protein
VALPAKATPAGVPALKGKTPEREGEAGGKATGKAAAKTAEPAEGDDSGSAQVVSLDSFRKKT